MCPAGPVTTQLEVQHVHGVGADTDPADSADPKQIGQGARQVALAADHHVLGGSGGDVVVAVAGRP